MPFEWLVALRFLREGRVQTFFILTGVGVGTTVIIFLSALITGLQQSIIDRTLGTQAQIVIRMPDEVPQVLDTLADARVERPGIRHFMKDSASPLSKHSRAAFRLLRRTYPL